MKKIFLLILSLTMCSCASMQSPSKITGQQVPFTKFYRLDGTYLLTDELSGKTAVVVFWASWCSYSRPALQRLDNYARNKLKREDVVFIAPSIDRSDDFQKLKDVISYLKTDKIEYFYSGNDTYDEAYMAFDAGVLPHVFIINPEGRVVIDGHKDSIVYDYFGIEP